MPLLNMAMNGVSLAREKMTDEDEKKIKNSNSMDSLRQLCVSDPDLETNLRESVGPCVDLLKERFARVSLKDVPIQITESATKEEEEELFDEIKFVDSSLKISDTSKVQVQKCQYLMDYLKSHAVEHRYLFQLKKCKKPPANHRILREGEDLINSSGLSPETSNVLVASVRKATTCNEVWFLVKAAEKKLELSKILDGIGNFSSYVKCVNLLVFPWRHS